MTKFALLASSLVPAFVVFAVRLLAHQRTIPITLLAISVLLTGLLIAAVHARRKTDPQLFAIESIQDESQQIPTYLVTFIFPFLVITVDDWYSIAAYLAFALLVLVLLFRTDLALVNPLLLVSGHHMYQFTTIDRRTLILIAKQKPLPGQTILATRLSTNTFKLDSIAE